MNQKRADVLAFLVAPLAPAIAFALSSPGLTGRNWAVSASMVPMFYSFAMFFTLILGLPAFLTLRRMSLVRWWSALAVGAVIGALVASLGQGFRYLSLDVVGFGVVVGAAEAMLFCLVRLSCRAEDGRQRL